MVKPEKPGSRKMLVITLIVCLCFNLIALNQLRRRFKFKSIDNVDISLAVKRLEKIGEKLPSIGHAGYIDDYLGEKELAQIDPAVDPEAWSRYYLTQYSLAPIIVEYNPKKQLIVGNFRDTKLAATLTSRGYKILEDFGRGIYLIERM